MILTQGDTFVDNRGTLRFFNNLDMAEIKRFYEISPSNTDFIRGWQGHKEEKKWFYCLSGSIVINIIKVSNFENPTINSKPSKVFLSADNPQILHVPGGNVTAIKAEMVNSRLQVFSNFTLKESKEDDFRYPLDLWNANWKI